MRLGVLGGSFDPVHLGHLNLAEALRIEAGLDKVLFMPTYYSYHKADKKMTSAALRLEMLEIATASNPFFEVCDIEIKRAKASYTYESYDELRFIYPEDEICFLGGSDIVLGIEAWKNSDYLLRNAGFVIGLRAGDDFDLIKSKTEYLVSEREAKIELKRVPLLEISSSYIRSKAARGESIRYLLTEGCEQLILEQGLYLNETDS